MKTKRRPTNAAETFGAAKLVTAEWLHAERARRLNESIERLREAEKNWRAQRALLQIGELI